MNKRKVPKIRFKGFHDDWEQRKLDEILIQRVEHQTISADAPLLAFSYADGVIDPEDKKSNKRDFIMADKYSKIFSRTELNDIIYNPANVIHGAIHRNKLGTGVVSPIYKIFVCNNVSPKYMGERLHTDIFIQEITKYIEGTVIKLRTLSPEMFLEMMVEIPSSYEEQEKIGKLFEYLDSLITLHQRKLEKMKIIKKSMLENCFPKNGEKVPKNRFSGFSDDWEQRKFGEVFIPLQNNTLSRAELNDEFGTAQNIHYGDVLIKYDEVLDVSKESLSYIEKQSIADKFKTSYLQNGDVIIADTAEDETVGKCTEIEGLTDQKVISGLHTMPVRPNRKFAAGFLGFYLNSAAYHDQLKPLMQGIKVTSISKGVMQDTVVKFPLDLKEQEQIGMYFSGLDHLITLHQSKLEKLKMIKKSMLETMFV